MSLCDAFILISF